MQNPHDKMPETTMAELRFVNETPGINGGYPNGPGAFIMGGTQDTGLKRSAAEAGFVGESDEESDTSDLTPAGQSVLQPGTMTTGTTPSGLKPGKKTKGRVKIRMEFIDNKLRRYTTFSKRKTGIMKKAYELSTLTGTQVMLLVASETGHVYTFATRKLQPMITSESGKALIQTCLNSPESPPMGSGGHDQRMNPTGFEEPELSYAVEDDQMDKDSANMYSSPTMVPMNNLSMESLTQGRSNTPSMSQATMVQSTPAPPPAHNSQRQHMVTPPQAHNTPAQQVSQPPPPPPPLQQMQVQPPRASVSPQHSQTISLTTYMPPTASTRALSNTTTTNSNNNNKPQNLSMQQITAFIPQPAGLPPGTPITISSMPQSQQNGSPAQQVFRLPTQGQVISVPVSVPSSSSNNTDNSSTGTAATAPSIASQPNSSVSVSTGSAPPGTIMYHTPQGVVYAATSASTLGALPEYLFNLQQSPTAFVSSDQQAGGTPAQQYITIPLPVSLAQGTQLLQPVITSSNGEAQNRDSDKGRK